MERKRQSRKKEKKKEKKKCKKRKLSKLKGKNNIKRLRIIVQFSMTHYFFPYSTGGIMILNLSVRKTRSLLIPRFVMQSTGVFSWLISYKMLTCISIPFMKYKIAILYTYRRIIYNHNCIMFTTISTPQTDHGNLNILLP
jgi:hypothetical protein